MAKQKTPKQVVIDDITFLFGKKDDEGRNTIAASAPSGAQWFVYRRHSLRTGAYYEVQDLRHWHVGTADSLRELAEKLSFSNQSMATLLDEEIEAGGKKK